MKAPRSKQRSPFHSSFLAPLPTDSSGLRCYSDVTDDHNGTKMRAPYVALFTRDIIMKCTQQLPECDSSSSSKGAAQRGVTCSNRTSRLPRFVGTVRHSRLHNRLLLRIRWNNRVPFYIIRWLLLLLQRGAVILLYVLHTRKACVRERFARSRRMIRITKE